MAKVLFIHHSTGANLIKEGQLRVLLNKLGSTIEFWDHSYNLYKYCSTILAKFTHHTGLSDLRGKLTGRDYNIVLSNNSPKEYSQIFSSNPKSSPLKEILTYDAIAFKNCYPTSKIISDKQLSEYKNYYLNIQKNLSKYKNNKFILVTFPPLRKNLTSKEYGARAKDLVEWLTSKEFTKDTKNIFVFNLFSLLADKDGFLKRRYERLIPIDSHPNSIANKEIAPIFAKSLYTILKKNKLY